jgi:hypothetical protein
MVKSDLCDAWFISALRTASELQLHPMTVARLQIERRTSGSIAHLIEQREHLGHVELDVLEVEHGLVVFLLPGR